MAMAAMLSSFVCSKTSSANEGCIASKVMVVMIITKCGMLRETRCLALSTMWCGCRSHERHRRVLLHTLATAVLATRIRHFRVEPFGFFVRHDTMITLAATATANETTAETD